MWAALRETQGVLLPSRNAIARLISAQPDLRGLDVAELAARLDCTPQEAQDGIATFARETFGQGVCVPPGQSFDTATMLAGEPAPPVQLVRAGDRLATVAGQSYRPFFQSVIRTR